MGGKASLALFEQGEDWGPAAHSHPVRPPTLVLSSTTRSPSADTHRTDFTDFRPI